MGCTYYSRLTDDSLDKLRQKEEVYQRQIGVPAALRRVVSSYPSNTHALHTSDLQYEPVSRYHAQAWTGSSPGDHTRPLVPHPDLLSTVGSGRDGASPTDCSGVLGRGGGTHA